MSPYFQNVFRVDRYQIWLVIFLCVKDVWYLLVKIALLHTLGRSSIQTQWSYNLI